LLLQQIGATFELTLVDRNSEGQKSPDYLRLNPTGRIPTLRHDDLVIFESAAICLYLCEQHPEAQLLPPPASAARAHCYQWLIYLTNTLQAALMIYIYPQQHCDPPTHSDAIVRAQESRITAMLSLLNQELGTADYLIDNSLSVCDFFLFMLSLWATNLSKPPLSFDNLNRYLCQLATLPAVIEVCQRESISLAAFD